MVFKSRIDLWIAIPIWILIIVFLRMLYEMIVQISIIGILVSLTMIVFIGAFWFNTRYEIEDELLIIKFGFIKKTIKIKDIKSIRKTNNPLASPALSIRKIEINYNKYETVQISPKDIDLLINELQNKNFKIKFKTS